MENSSFELIQTIGVLLILTLFIFGGIMRQRKQNNGVNSKGSTSEDGVRYSLQQLDNMEGHQFEYAIANMLKQNNYSNVQVTKGSGDYGVDIIASCGEDRIAVQCKRHSKPAGVKAVQEVYAGMKYYYCNKAVVVTNNSFTPQARELARRSNVQLWGRRELVMFMNKGNADVSQAVNIRENTVLDGSVSGTMLNSINSNNEYQEVRREFENKHLQLNLSQKRIDHSNNGNYDELNCTVFAKDIIRVIVNFMQKREITVACIDIEETEENISLEFSMNEDGASFFRQNELKIPLTQELLLRGKLKSVHIDIYGNAFGIWARKY